MRFFSPARRSLLAILSLFAVALAHADTFPSKPVRIITPGAPGGITDGTLRVLATELSRVWRQPVLVENKPGATGLIALQATMAAPPDGHVLGMQVSGFMIALPLAHGPRYAPLESGTPITFISEYPLVLAAAAAAPYSNWQEFVQFRDRSGKRASYGTTGIGGTPHLAVERIKKLTHQDLQDVAYKGDAPMLADLVGNQLAFGLPILGSAMPLIKGGQVKGLAVTSAVRVPYAPNIPTLREQGVDVVATPWNYLQGPPKMDPELVARIARDVAVAMNSKAVKDFYQASVLLWSDMNREQLLARIKSDSETAHALIQELKIPVN